MTVDDGGYNTKGVGGRERETQREKETERERETEKQMRQDVKLKLNQEGIRGSYIGNAFEVLFVDFIVSFYCTRLYTLMSKRGPKC